MHDCKGYKWLMMLDERRDGYHFMKFQCSKCGVQLMERISQCPEGYCGMCPDSVQEFCKISEFGQKNIGNDG